MSDKRADLNVIARDFFRVSGLPVMAMRGEPAHRVWVELDPSSAANRRAVVLAPERARKLARLLDAAAERAEKAGPS